MCSLEELENKINDLLIKIDFLKKENINLVKQNSILLDKIDSLKSFDKFSDSQSSDISKDIKIKLFTLIKELDELILDIQSNNVEDK